jgi:hypothetical protein
MCKKIGPDDEHLGSNAFQSYLNKDSGECTEQRATSYMAFYDTDECEELFYNLRLNGQIPEGMTVVEFDADVCACE